MDLLILRELTGGLYFGKRREAATAADAATAGEERSAHDELPYSESEIRRIVELAFELAAGRRRRRHERGQGQRARHQPPLADRRGRSRPGAPGHRAGASPGRLVRHAADHAAGRLRRGRHREPVRRHPLRRGVRADRLAGHAAVGVARRARDGARPLRPVRAGPRLGAGHRRPRTSPTRSAPSSRPPCCCAGRWDVASSRTGSRPR